MFGVQRCCSYALPPTSWLPIVATHGYGAQLVGCEEGGPLRLGAGGLDLVTAGDQQLGVRVRGEGDLQRVRPARLVFGHVARRADLRVAEEQEVEVAVELAGLERVRRGPGAIATDAVGVRGVLLQVVEDRVAVEASVDRVGGDDGRVGPRAAREMRRSGARDVGATCTTWLVSAEAYQFTTRCDSSAPTRRMMPLMVAGAAVTTLASLMLAAAIATRAHSVMRLRTEECDAREVSSFIFRFIFRMPLMSDELTSYSYLR